MNMWVEYVGLKFLKVKYVLNIYMLFITHFFPPYTLVVDAANLGTYVSPLPEQSTILAE